MNTFLPFSSFQNSFSVLDQKRLNKQNLESWQLINGQWPHHPASKMWAQHLDVLKSYFNLGLAEWKSRGFKSKLEPFDVPICDFLERPNLVYISHRVNLLRKNFDWYSKFEWVEGKNLNQYPQGYFWDVPLENLGAKAKQDTENWLAFWRYGF